jgi:hypothetical protein
MLVGFNQIEQDSLVMIHTLQESGLAGRATVVTIQQKVILKKEKKRESERMKRNNITRV